MDNMITLYIMDLDTREGREYLQEIELNIISVDTQIHTCLCTTDSVHDVALIEAASKPENYPKERKVGTATFIVSSRFNNEKACDIISRIARLIQQDNENTPYLCG